LLRAEFPSLKCLAIDEISSEVKLNVEGEIQLPLIEEMDKKDVSQSTPMQFNEGQALVQ